MTADETAKQKLISWYQKNRRDLPWRRTKDPYPILVSEVMLQQTTVGVVIPYFEKFVKTFPTAKALAHAPEEKVLSLWSGLGYYSRARNLQKAAQVIDRLGAFPETYEELVDLPGVGPYTAAAVASIAFGETVAAVDGNVSRVITRIFDISQDISSKQGKDQIAASAQAMIQDQPPSDHNQAMMELGATICIPQNPACLLCPVSKSCQSFRNGTVTQRPVKAKKRKQEPWLWTLFVVKRGGKIGLVKNFNGTPWLKNTWTLPGNAEPWKKAKPPESDFRHSITHHKIFVKMKRASLNELDQRQEILWVKPDEAGSLGVSSVVQKAMKLLPLFMLFAFLACSSKPPATSHGNSGNGLATPMASPSKPVPDPSGIQQLTFMGENSQAAFSPDGAKLMFQSKNREDHPNSQIYLYDLKTKKERRLTFNDGEDTTPVFAPNGKSILYASTTDELKEHPDAPRPSYPYLNYEIYKADADGDHRVRLTNDQGYDAEAVYSHEGRKILFVSRRDGHSDMYVMDPEGRFTHKFLNEGSGSKESPDRSGPVYSPDGKKVVWSERTADGSAQIIVSDSNGKNMKQITTKAETHINPQWVPGSKALVFSANNRDLATFDIYFLSLDGTCFAELTQSPKVDLFPAISPDGKTLVFTSNRTGTFQIYQTEFQIPAATSCSQEKP